MPRSRASVWALCSVACFFDSTHSLRLRGQDCSNLGCHARFSNGRPLQVHNGRVLSVALSPDDSRIIFSLRGRHYYWIWSVELSPSGVRVVTAGLDGEVQIWDTVSGAPIGVRLLQQSVAFSPHTSLQAPMTRQFEFGMLFQVSQSGGPLQRAFRWGHISCIFSRRHLHHFRLRRQDNSKFGMLYRAFRLTSLYKGNLSVSG
jgi:hypothetical protein